MTSPGLRGRLRGVDQPERALDYALHRARSWWHLEKWYADAITPDGDVLVVLLTAVRVAGAWFGRVTADLARSDGATVRGDAPASRIAGGLGWLRFGPARIEGDVLVWSTPGLSGELTVRPRAEAVTMRDPLVASGHHALGWAVEAPDADVAGELRWPGASRSLAGRGYRDRVWTDIPPWRLPLRTLRWGRAVTASHATTWIDAETLAGRLRWRWEDGVVLPGGRVPAGAGEGVGNEPDATDVPGLSLGARRVLVDARVADIPSLRLGPLRGLLRWLSRDVRQTRWSAPVWWRGEAGWAVHEEVAWR